MRGLRFSAVIASLLFCLAPLPSQSVDLAEAARQTGAELYWDPLSGSGILEKNGHQLSFRVGEQLILMNYSKLAIIDPPENRNGTIYVTDRFITKAQELFSQTAPEAFYKVGAILIDPGHGGRDPGAIGSYKKGGKTVTLQEKDLVLSISKTLAQQLEAAYPDKDIVLTRSDDTWLTLEQRVDIANSIRLEPHEAILYISIHINASLDRSASGYEVWYLSPGFRRTVLESTGEDKDLENILNSMMEEEYTTESVLIAKFIMDGLDAQVGKQSRSRGIKAEEWFVVRNANMPSVLVEAGFVTNEKEAALLDDDQYLRKLAHGIYNGLSAFIAHFERSRGFTGTE